MKISFPLLNETRIESCAIFLFHFHFFFLHLHPFHMYMYACISIVTNISFFLEKIKIIIKTDVMSNCNCNLELFHFIIKLVHVRKIVSYKYVKHIQYFIDDFLHLINKSVMSKAIVNAEWSTAWIIVVVKIVSHWNTVCHFAVLFEHRFRLEFCLIFVN